MNNTFQKHAKKQEENAALVERMDKGRTHKIVDGKTIIQLSTDAQNAKTELIEKNTAFVVTAVRKYSNIGNVPFQDRLAHGLAGFSDSLDKVTPSQSGTLLTHSTFYIKSAINSAIRSDYGAITLTDSTQRRLRAIEKISYKLSKAGLPTTDTAISEYAANHDDTDNKLSKASDQVIRDTRYAAHINKTSASINHSYDADKSISKQLDIAAKSEEPEYASIKEEEQKNTYKLIWAALNTLDNRARDIIDNRPPYSDITLQALGEKWDVSTERIRQLEKNAHKSMKQYLIEHNVSEPE